MAQKKDKDAISPSLSPGAINEIPREHMYGLSPATVALEEARRRQVEAALPINVRIESRPDMYGTVSHTVDLARMIRAQVHLDLQVVQEHPLSAAHHVAREVSRLFAEQMERQIRDELIRAYQGERNQDYRPRGMTYEALMHVRDLTVGGLSGRYKKPEKPEPFEKITKSIAKEIEKNGFVATLLCDSLMVWHEAEAMSHCLYKSYTNRMLAGSYIAFHVTAPERKNMPKSGFTLGYRREGNKWEYDQLKGKKNSTHYCSDKELLDFCSHITNVINSGANQHEKEEKTHKRGAVNFVKGVFGN